MWNVSDIIHEASDLEMSPAPPRTQVHEQQEEMRARQAEEADALARKQEEAKILADLTARCAF